MKVRVIPSLLMRGSGLVKSVQFANWRRIGSLTQALNVYRSRDVDELVFLDIDAHRSGLGPDLDVISEVATAMSVPLSVGGGITTVRQAELVLQMGVEKVVINSAFHGRPELVGELAAEFGSQSIIAALDVRRGIDGAPICYARGATEATGQSPVEWALELEARGAGELLVSAVDRDGLMQGYDLELARAISGAVRIPVIASCGAGQYEHLREAVVVGGASAVAASSIFHFTEMTPDGARRHLEAAGIPVRATWRP
jgi:cyclase